MPSVPAASFSVAADPLAGLSVVRPDLLSPYDHSVGPTPDPDMDDVVLVATGDGAVITQPFLEQVPPQASVKPRIELTGLSLHSPSSIVGTPFDLSPRFEYPFPAPQATPDPVIPSHPVIMSSLSGFPAALPPLPVSLPLPLPLQPTSPPVLPKSRVEQRSFSPTHPKLHMRDPPVPPGLVKKRQNMSLTTSTDSASQTRIRGESMSIISDAFGRPSEERTRTNAPGQSGRATPDLTCKRNSIAVDVSRGPVGDLVKTKPFASYGK